MSTATIQLTEAQFKVQAERIGAGAEEAHVRIVELLKDAETLDGRLTSDLDAVGEKWIALCQLKVEGELISKARIIPT